MRRLIQYRFSLSAFLALGTAVWLQQHIGLPVPARSPLLSSVMFHSPPAYYALRCSWLAVLFGMPMLYFYLPVLSLLYRGMRLDKKKVRRAGQLPPYPPVKDRKELFVVLGEDHLGDRIGPSDHPQWLTIPAGGLVLGTLALGSPGTGKTAGCILPIAEQVFGYKARDPGQRAGGLVLEVKGDLCPQIKDILVRHGRGEDYLEIGFDSEYRYNPLDPDASPSNLAFNLVSVMDSLRGAKRGGDSFWDDAATALVTFLIILHRFLYGYVTLLDLRLAAGNLELLQRFMEQAEASLPQSWMAITKAELEDLPDELSGAIWLDADDPEDVRIEFEQEFFERLTRADVRVRKQDAGTEAGATRLETYNSALVCWNEIRAMDPRLLTAVAKGITNFLEIFNVDPQARRIFCPPKECFDPVLNADGRYGRPLPKLSEVVETSTVIALSLPIAADEAFARVSATLIKTNWCRAMLNRIPEMQKHPERHWRYQALIIDEYDKLATVGGSKPIGDEKVFTLSRAAKLIPVVAFQTLSGLKATVGDLWDVIFSAFATTIVLRQKSVFSAREISAAVGREDMIRDAYGLSEGAQDANVSYLSGRTTSQQSSMNISHGFNVARDNIIEVKQIMELPRGTSVVLANNGIEQLSPRFCYLKPPGSSPNDGYFGASQ